MLVRPHAYVGKGSKLPPFDELGRPTTRPETKLSRYLQAFRFTLPLLSMEPELSSIQVDSQQTQPLDDVLTPEELACLDSQASEPSESLFLIPQPKPELDLIDLAASSAWLESVYPHLTWACFEDLWRLLSLFRIPDQSLILTGAPWKKADGSQCIGGALHRYILFCPYGDNYLKIAKPLLKQSNSIFWLARPNDRPTVGQARPND